VQHKNKNYAYHVYAPSSHLIDSSAAVGLGHLNYSKHVLCNVQGSYGVVKLAYNQEDDTHYVS